jgi:hypothetical protein
MMAKVRRWRMPLPAAARTPLSAAGYVYAIDGGKCQSSFSPLVIEIGFDRSVRDGPQSRSRAAPTERSRPPRPGPVHPNIAKVFDAGTTTGEPGCVSAERPYFVMELVKGVPITRFCNENQLTPRERLDRLEGLRNHGHKSRR